MDIQIKAAEEQSNLAQEMDKAINRADQLKEQIFGLVFDKGYQPLEIELAVQMMKHVSGHNWDKVEDTAKELMKAVGPALDEQMKAKK